MKESKKIVIVVHGGMVQDVYSEDPNVAIVIEDRDTEEYDPDHKEDTSKMTLVY